ncbi:diguanylate cyclase (GGDEF) domain-containing protein [Aquimonas voraii]|uniref:diguanylate cyclase n=1 Tax=Aquimonas voraii TaxID=265719 RepID=A0A1G6UE12_9GAMM|nr:diguanylate cyclase (GGDEF) domain-containing protein [Aquimonas voraii]
MRLLRGPLRRRAWLWLLAALSMLVVLVAAAADGAQAQQDLAPRLLFQGIGDDQQLRDGVITGLAQDAHGFLWVGTTEGLIRHDGYRFKPYRHVHDDPQSLPGNRIEHLFTDRDGRLWIGTYAHGVARHDAERDVFVALQPPRDPASLPRVPGPAPARAFAQTPDGAVWVGTSGLGLWRIAPDDRITVFEAADTWAGLPDDRISALAVDRQGNLWVGSWAGLAVLPAGSERFQRVLSDPGDPQGFHNVTVRGLHASADGALWVGAQDGRLLRLPSAEALAAAAPVATHALPQPWLRMGLNSAVETADGRLWIAHGRGLELFAADGRHVSSYRHRRGEPYGLTDMGIRDLLIDRSGWLWLGSFGGGLLRSFPGDAPVQSRRLNPERDAPLERLSVSSIAAEPDGGFWAVVDGFGLVRMDARLAIRETLPLVPAGQPGLAGLLQYGVSRGDDGSLWVATELGLYRRAPGEALPQRVTDPDFIEGKLVRRVWPGRQGAVWIGTGDGLFLRRADGEVLRLATADGSRVGGAINSLQFDASGAWLGGSAGLFRVDAERLAIEPISVEVDGRPRSLDVLGLLLDARGQLWLDAGGLLKLENFDGRHARLQSISGRHGQDGVAFGANLLDDARGRIWSQRFMYDPGADRLFPLGPREGALAGSGWFRSYARLADGRFAFGMNQGVLVVDSERFDDAGGEVPLVFTGLRVDGVEQPIGPRGGELVLAPEARGFALEFAALDYTAPELLRYRYRLLGGDESWIEVGADARVAAFGGLWPGRYRVQVQASNRAGQFVEAPIELPVQVLPAWWQRPHLLALLAVLAAVLIEAMVRLRRRRLQQRQRALQAEVAARTAELERLGAELEQRSRVAEEASLTDALTGLRNRRFAELELPKEAGLYQRRPLSIAAQGAQAGGLVLFLLDLDHFKRVNDAFGHAAGDAVLRQVAARLREACRASDHLIRWGGEEFLVAARDTDRAAALGLAERLRQRIGGQPFRLDDGRSLQLTVSLGFVPFPLSARAPFAARWDEAVDLADRLLFAGKRAGRDAWVGLFVERDAGAPARCVEWADPARIEAGDVRIESNLPLAELVRALGPGSEATRGAGAADAVIGSAGA